MSKIKKNKIRDSFQDRIFNIINPILMVVMLVIFVWPLWFVIIASFSDPNAVLLGEVLFLPKGVQFEGYKLMLEYTELWTGYANTIFYTVVGTAINLFLSVCFAYPLSRKDLKGRRFLLLTFTFTMYFSGGLIPTYLVVRDCHMIDTPWAMMIPGAISVYNCLIIRSYYMNSIPRELQEAAELDGANAAQYLVRVVLPLSKPVMAVVGLYYAVGHWNDYYNALIYIYNDQLLPLQSVMKNLLMSISTLMDNLNFFGGDPAYLELMYNRVMSMKYCVIIAAVVPMMCVYPFVQKFFVKGVMVGSVKG